jgi:hypothetical protein
MARGSIAQLMKYVGCLSLRRDIMFYQVCSRDEEYKRKVERSVEPVVVILLSKLDNKCRAVASDNGAEWRVHNHQVLPS